MTQVPPSNPPAALSYASPYGNHDGDAWVKNGLLHIRNGAILPMCCIRCGSTDRLRSRHRNLAWTPSWMYILLLFPGPLIAGIIILINQKKASLTTFTCSECRWTILIRGLLTFALFGAGIACFFLAAALRDGAPFILIGILVIITSVIFGVIACRQFSIVRIDPPFAILKGIHRDFLRNIPN